MLRISRKLANLDFVPSLRLCVLVAVASLAVLSSARAVPLIGVGTPIPDDNVLLDFAGSGLDWVYAGPIAPNEFGPGEIEVPSFRAGEGWRYATAAEWAIKPLWQDFIKSPFVDADVLYTTSDHTKYRFASEYWSTFTHVDPGDANQGFITNGFDIGSLDQVWETWYVRDTTVPEPTTFTLTALGLLAMCCRRRKRA